jgi:type I restriction enzyme, S subunit
MKKYLEYKDSGIAWLREIPEHWGIESFKNILTERNEKNNPVKCKEILSLSIDKGVTLYAEKTTNLDRFKDDLTKYKLAYKGDLVLNSMNMIVGAVGVSDYFGCVSPVYYTYHGDFSNSNTTKFYEYLFRCKIVQGVLYSLGRGLIAIDRGEGKYNTLRLKVSREDLRSLKLPFPNISEQTKIAAFLDYKLAKIDRFIRKKKQLIKLLNKQKAAIINQAVTKGLDPNAKMKPSGIEWLGDIPEHWDLKRLKYLAKICNGSDCDKKETGEYPVFGSGGIFGKTNTFIYDKVSVLLGRKGTIDKPQFVDEPFWTVDTAFYTKINEEEVIPIFFYHLCCNIPFEYYGSKTALPSMTQTSLYEVKFPVPLRKEQEDIIKSIEYSVGKLNKTISTIEKEITLTQEYKTALIAEVVTGKIDVRDCEIPEENN